MTWSAKGFERQIYEDLDKQFPFCVLPNLILFRADRAASEDLAYEIDHLLHYREAGIDYIVVVECKNQKVHAADKAWTAFYDSGPSDVRRQLISHADALLNYIRPIAQNIELRVKAWAVSSDASTRSLEEISHDKRIQLRLMSYQNFLSEMRKLKRPYRVTQSEFLGLLRLGLPVNTMGHPELPNALSYIERCRRSIDAELFRSFKPSRQRWAINGSAGMGKSVLLAYALFVFASDRHTKVDGDRKFLSDFAARAKELELSPLKERGIYAFAMKQKQQAVLETLYRKFVDELSALDETGELWLRKPIFKVWDGEIPADCNILVVDEAHDLLDIHQNKISTWLNEDGKNRYLLIACDRHQKLRLIGRDEPMLRGVNFSGATEKLHRNYRNPFPVFAAGLALMFRWFAADGPKVIPTKDDLKGGFGFEVDDAAGGNLKLSMRNDAHPANSWSHSIGIFPTCSAAFVHLRQFHFGQEDVLWVRFSGEDPNFNYEQLARFTYHNFKTAESADLADKYIKGQDFPIVVVEGFPEEMEMWAEGQADPTAEEQKMWGFRKLLYLCCSRATGFLFLVSNTIGDKRKIIEAELEALVEALAIPSNREYGSGKTWSFQINRTATTRPMDVFQDQVTTLEASVTNQIKAGTTGAPSKENVLPENRASLVGVDATVPVKLVPILDSNTQVQVADMQSDVIRITRPIVVNNLALQLDMKPYLLKEYLKGMKIIADDRDVLDDAAARMLGEKMGFELEIIS